MSFLKPLGLSAASLLIGGMLLFSIRTQASSLQPADASFSIAQNAEQSDSSKPQGRKAAWESLGLTETQKTQIKQIKANSRQQLEAVLTPEQKQQWQAAKAQTPRQKPNLNLSEAQKASIKTIREQSKSQIDAILTPEQRQKRQELRTQWQQKRQQK
jgi:Spy/CpxP family protein refolding chaperone